MSEAIIGRVGVKVWPDARAFRREATEELRKVEARLPKVKVEAVLDKTSLKRSALEAVRDVNNDLKVNDAYKVRFKARIDASGMRGEARRAVREIQAQATDLRVKFKAAINTVGTEVDEESLKKTEFKLKHWARSTSPLNVGVAPNLIAFSTAFVRSRLSVLTRPRRVSIIPELDSKGVGRVLAGLAALSGTRAIQDLTHDFGSWLGTLDKALPKIGAISLAVTNLGSAAAMGVSNVLALGGSLASIGATGFALPGILGGITLGVVAFAVAMKDFNKHFPDFAISGTKATSAGKAWKKLQDVMSSNFWKNAAAPIRELIQSLFPQFSKGMAKISTQLGTFTGNLASSLKGVFNHELGSMFDDLSKSIEIAGRHTDSFAGILRTLGRVGAGMLPRLAGWFGRVADQFNRWLSRTERSGELQRWIDDGVTGLKHLGNILANAGRSLRGLSRAAESVGGSNLAILDKTMSDVAKTINSAPFQRGLRTFFKGAHDGMQSLYKAAGPNLRSFLIRLSKTLGNVLPTAGKAAGDALGAIFGALDQPQVQRAVQGFFKDILKAVRALAPAMPAAARALAAILSVAGAVAVGIARALGPALQRLAPRIEDLARNLKPLATSLGQLVGSILTAAGPAIGTLIGMVSGLAVAVKPLVDVINGLFEAFNTLPEPMRAIVLIAGASAFLGPLIVGKVAQFSGALVALALKFPALEGGLLAFGGGVENAVGKLSKLKLGIAGLGIGIAGIGTSAAGSNKGVSALTGALGGAIAGASLGSVIPGVGTAIGGLIGGVGGGLYGLVKASNASKDAIKGNIQPAIDFKNTLDALTGSATAVTRELVLQQAVEAGVVGQARALGVTVRDVVNATLGHKSALDRVNAALAKNQGFTVTWRDSMGGVHAAVVGTKKQLDEMTRSIESQGGVINQTYAKDLNGEAKRALLDFIGTNNREWASATAAKRRDIMALQDLTSLQKALPRKIFTQIDAVGIKPTLRGIASVVSKYNLLGKRKKIQAIIEAVGVDLSVRQVQRFIKQLKDAGRQKPKPKVTVDTKFANRLIGETRKRLEELDRTSPSPRVSVSDTTRGALNNVNGNLNKLARTVAKPKAVLVDRASSQIRSIRTQLASLHDKTITVTVSQQPSGGGGGGGKSPRTIPGFTPRVFSAAAAEAARNAAIKAAEAFGQTLGSKLGKVKGLFANLLTKVSKTERDHVKQLFDDRVTRFEDLTKKYNQWIAQLGRAKDKLASLRQELADFKQNIVDSIKALADPTTLEDQSFGSIVGHMQDVLQQTKDFAAAIKQLIKLGLNSDTLSQLLTAGPEAALAAAQAIADAGKDGVKEINSLQTEINQTASQVATAGGTALFGQSIQSAIDDVQKLLNKINPLRDKIKTFFGQLTNALTDAIKQAQKALKDGKAGGGTTARAVAPRTASTVSGTAVRTATQGVVQQKVLNYYAAPNSSLPEEDLFTAANRARMVW